MLKVFNKIGYFEFSDILFPVPLEIPRNESSPFINIAHRVPQYSLACYVS